MKLLTIKSGAVLTGMLLALTLVSCSPYANVGVSANYGRPYGGYYGYRPYGYGYRAPVIVSRPPVVVNPRRYYTPRSYYSTPRSYGPRAYGGGGYRGNNGRRR